MFTEIFDFNAPELDIFVRLTGAQLRRRIEAENGIFIAESPTVIEVALMSGCEPISFLTDKRLLSGSLDPIIEKISKFAEEHGTRVDFFCAERDVLKSLTGFELTRGALCAMRRPREISVEELLKNATRVAVLEEIADSTNIGALFRCAAGIGMDAVLITPTCCDPLCRRAVRVSMGTVFQVPWGKIGKSPEDWPERGIEKLHSLGFKTVAMALTDDSVGLDSRELANEKKLAIILGTEGTGLSPETIAECDYTVKIPMAHGVDSLNVACAGAIAFWELRKSR